jgi:GntR family transcriptional repressor for pyruvate dehydrogenase complex
LGALDLWFQGLPAPPLEVFESRSLLEDLFCGLALERASEQDVAAMRAGLVEMERVAEDPRAFFEANVRFHQVIARASGAPLLVSFYDALVAVMLGGLARIAYSGEYRPIVSHNLRVHGQLIEAIALRDRSRLATAIALHHKDMTSMEEPDLSPRAETVVPVDAERLTDRSARSRAAGDIS